MTRRRQGCKLLFPGSDNSGEEGEESDGESDSREREEKTWMAELTWRKNHPERLHDELWFNLPLEVGPFICFKTLSRFPRAIPNHEYLTKSQLRLAIRKHDAVCLNIFAFNPT